MSVVDAATRRVSRRLRVAAAPGAMTADGRGGVWVALADTARPNVVRLRP